MKNIKYYTGIIALIFSMGVSQSCTDLTEITYDKLSPESVGNTPEQYIALALVPYGKLQDISWAYYDLNCLVATDCALAPTRGANWYDGGMWQDLATHNWTSANSEFSGSWSLSTSGITSVNQVLDQLSTIVPPSEEIEAEVIAQLRALRALFLYFQIDLFGDVPLVTDFQDLSLPERTSRADVFDYIVSELLAVEDLVPATNGGKNYGRMTKGAVDMLLAKMYLNAQVWKGIPMWNEAIVYCDKVMANTYTLEPNFKTNFLAQNEVSKENILVVPFSENSGGFALLSETLHYLSAETYDLSTGPWNGYCSNPDYFNAFDPNDPRREYTYIWGQQYSSSGDSLYVSKPLEPLDYNVNFTSLTNAMESDGARCGKYEIENGAGYSMNNDFVIFRLADAYLMKAEALLRSGGSQATALDLVNIIRERAYGDSNNNLTYLNLDNLLSERAFEFAWEGPRRQDLIRYEVASGTPYWTRAWMFKPVSSNKTLLYPVPIDAISANSNLTQNSGY